LNQEMDVVQSGKAEKSFWGGGDWHERSKKKSGIEKIDHQGKRNHGNNLLLKWGTKNTGQKTVHNGGEQKKIGGLRLAHARGKSGRQSGAKKLLSATWGGDFRDRNVHG